VDVVSRLRTAEQRKIAADRVLELKLLMDKAEQGPGGAAVNVIAYQGDYLMAREELKVIDAATRGKITTTAC
jgi:hypothetical protein